MNKSKLIAATLTAALTLGGATAFAAGPSLAQDNDDGRAGSSFTGSIEAPGENEARDDAAEDRELQNLAEIDENAAEQAALEAVPGRAGDVELDDENGYVVYDVEVAGDDGRSHDVGVDAGNGDVLYQHDDGNLDDDSGDVEDDDQDEGSDDD